MAEATLDDPNHLVVYQLRSPTFQESFLFTSMDRWLVLLNLHMVRPVHHRFIAIDPSFLMFFFCFPLVACRPSIPQGQDASTLVPSLKVWS